MRVRGAVVRGPGVREHPYIAVSLCWAVAALILGGCGDGSSHRPSGRATSTTVSQPGTGAYGTVVAAPTCPVERIDRTCPPRPVSAGIEARTRGGQLVAKTASDAGGRYRITLAPGDYTLSGVTSSGLPRCPSATITVRAR